MPEGAISGGKKGDTIALRTGPSMRECSRIIESIVHFYGHLGIACCGSLGLCSVENRADAADWKGEILEYCRQNLLEK